MNYGELKTAILSDSHREDYTPYIERFVAQAEALISSRLEAYLLTATLDDTDRTGADSPVYDLPSKLTLLRHVHINDLPLTQTDEGTIAQWRTAADVGFYCVRGNQIITAGTPAAGTELQIQYFGMPEALAEETDTNSLLTEYPQLYIEAAQVYVYKRARNFEAAQIAFQSVGGLLDEINRKVKKKLGGAQPVNPYNVSFRSSY